MALFQDFPTHGTRENAVSVLHSCGHQTTYEYGGTAPTYDAPRAAFSLDQANLPCPECAVIAARATYPLSNEIPVAGGHLISRDGKVLYRNSKPLIVHKSDPDHALPPHPRGYFQGPIDYSYRATILEPFDANYLHRQEGYEYTPEQLSWIDEYVVTQIVTNGGWHSYYCMGFTLSNWYQIEEAERRTGKKVMLSNDDIDRAEDAREEARTARQENALELACELGIMPGAMPADI